MVSIRKYVREIIMKKIFRACLLFMLFFVVNADRIDAAHIVGGEVTYRCLGVNQANNTFRLEITLTLYRDQFGGGAGFDATARIGIFRGSGNNWSHFRTLTKMFSGDEVLPLVDDPCVEVPGGLGVQKAQYVFTTDQSGNPIELPIALNSYTIAYQRCCRNNTIFNIENPGSTGAAYTIEITPEAQMECNNSPLFNSFPPVLICAGFDIDFDHSATDVDGDILIYEFCAPLQAGGTDGATTPGDPDSCTGVTPDPLNCPPPYAPVAFDLPTFSAFNPMGGSPQVTINPNTGLISGVPEILGQYVVGVCVSEFRNGVLIGKVRRDFQFNVTTCTPLVVADIENDAVLADQEFIINSCGSNTVFFENLSYEQDHIDAVEWSFDVNGTDVILNSWDAEVTFPRLGEYFGTLILNPGSAECSDTATIYVNIYPDITADFEFEYDTCVAGPVDFFDMSFTGADDLVNWYWDFGTNEQSNLQNPSHLFSDPGVQNVRLIAEDNNTCRDTVRKDIEWFPVPPLLVVEPSSFIGCTPANITFNNLSMPIDTTYTIVWDFGDGSMGDEISPSHVFNEVGTYSINLEITSPIGCMTEEFFPNLIRVEPSPVADFSFSPDEPSNFEPTILFFDESEDAISWHWNFNYEGTSSLPNPSFTFRDTGIYEIQLVVLHPSGCPDTTIQFIDVIPKTTYHMPNAFTPNNDSTNDTFLGLGITDGISEFNMTIWNRWGERIFATVDPYVGWNGTKNNTGSSSPMGVYIYHVSYVEPRGMKRELNGHVTLIR